jgi:hypothetical protein
MTLSALENSAFVPEYRPGNPPASKEQQLGSVADPGREKIQIRDKHPR